VKTICELAVANNAAIAKMVKKIRNLIILFGINFRNI